MKTKQLRSAALKAELAKADAKINELGPIFDKLSEDLSSANTKFLNNEIRIEDLLGSETHKNLIGKSIDTLAENRKRIEGEIEAALAIEAHQDTVDGMRALATTMRRSAGKQHDTARKLFNDATQALLDTGEEFRQIRLNFMAYLQKLVPGLDVERYPAIFPPKLRPQFEAAVAALTQAGMTKEDFDFVMTQYPSFTKLEHEALIAEAERYQMRQAATKAAYERADNADKMRAQQAQRQKEQAERDQIARRELALKQQNQTYEKIKDKLYDEENKKAA